MNLTDQATTPTPTSVSALALGVAEATLGVLRRGLSRPELRSVGRVLAETLEGWPDSVGRALAAADGSGVASRTVVPTAQGDRVAYESALLLVPAGVVVSHEVVVRLDSVPQEWEFSISLIAPAEDLAGLAAGFHAFVEHAIGPGSPFRNGAYQVHGGVGGLELSGWTPGPSVRADLTVPDEVWRAVDRQVVAAIELAPVLATEGLAASSGLLCVGPPGTGKSQLARIVAGELAGRATVLVVRASAARSRLRAVLRLASRLAPSLVILDDVDLVVGSRAGGEGEVLQEFLASMDETMTEAEGVVVLASTNDPRSIDPAAVRASRFDTVVEMVAPGVVARVAVLRRHLSRFPDLDFARLAAATEGATGADLRDLARRAYLAAGGEVTTAAVLAAATEGRWSADLTTGAYL